MFENGQTAFFEGKCYMDVWKFLSCTFKSSICEEHCFSIIALHNERQKAHVAFDDFDTYALAGFLLLTRNTPLSYNGHGFLPLIYHTPLLDHLRHSAAQIITVWKHKSGSADFLVTK